MKTLFMLFSLLLCIVAYSQEPTNKDFTAEINSLENPFKDDPTAEKYGYRVYKKVCYICHGQNGCGLGPQAQELENKPANFNHPTVVERTDGALYWWIANGGNDMQAFKDVLSDEEIWQVINYIRKVQTAN